MREGEPVERVWRTRIAAKSRVARLGVQSREFEDNLAKGERSGAVVPVSRDALVTRVDGILAGGGLVGGPEWGNGCDIGCALVPIRGKRLLREDGCAEGEQCKRAIKEVST